MDKGRQRAGRRGDRRCRPVAHLHRRVLPGHRADYPVGTVVANGGGRAQLPEDDPAAGRAERAAAAGRAAAWRSTWAHHRAGAGVALNAGSYFFSDRLALAATGARPLGEAEAPWLYAMVGELAARMDLPMPRLYLSPSPQPNAFATGRNPRHAAVAVTQGILSVLDERELRAVLAHELSHVANRDILITSIAATIATAITYVAQLGFYLGGPDDENAPNPLAAFLLVLLAPIAAVIIQLAIS